MSLVAAVIDAIENMDDIDVEDTAGEDAVYQATRVTCIDTDPGVELPVGTMCGNCGDAVTQVPGGRRRLYCSDACRQAAHRAAHT